jgi:hypothetical protein
MKKLLFIILLFPSVAYSQYLGVKVGFTNSNIPDHGMQRLTALNAGLYYMYGKGKFKVTAEPSINTKGFSFKGTITDNSGQPIMDGRFNYRFQYFELPLSFGYYPVNKKALLGFNGGFAPVIFLKTYNDLSGTSSNNVRPLNIDVFLGAIVGYNITEKINTSVNIRYGTSLGSTYNDNKNYLYNFLNCFLTVTHRI